MEVRVLGEIDVVTGDGAVEIRSRSQRIVLAVLAARAPAVVATDVLVDAVWAGEPPPSATGSLRTYVSRLRRVLGDRIVGTPGGYRLEVGDDEIDVARFEGILDEAARTSPVDALALLDRALALWRGRPFADLDDLEPVRAVVIRLTERWVAAREARAAALLTIGRPDEAVAAAEELVLDHPLREASWTTLVDALAATGRSTEALRAYQRAADALADAGVEPGVELRRAEAKALADDRPPEAGRRPALPRSTLVGRARERAEVAAAVLEQPLVTLVGPGGVGKTRLARAVAADLAERFPMGVRIVELAGVEHPEQVTAAIVDDLGLIVHADGPAAALERVGDLELLVVVDNCEHVIDAAADAVGRMLAGGSRLRVLATSREPLAIDAEHRRVVAPLPLTGPDGATALFLDRARAARPDFSVGTAESELVSDICERLDGLPLAVEMAAAALRVLPLPEVAERLANETDLPANPRRDVDDRHRTLRDVVLWSMQSLAAEERDVLHSFTVFAGWVTASDVAAVIRHADPLDVLCRLADRSLLVSDQEATAARFRMLRTIRQALPAPRPELLERHATWVAGAVAEADQRLRGPDERRAHLRMEQLFDDARRAVTWALAHDAPRAARTVASLSLFGQSRQRDEVLAWAADLVERAGPPGPGPVASVVLAAAAHRALSRGDLTSGRSLAERAVAAGGPQAPPFARELLADAQMFAGELERSRDTALEGRRLARALGDRQAETVCLVNAVLACAYSGDHVQAGDLMREAPPAGELAPSERAWLRYAEGERVLDREPLAAIAALDEAAAEASTVGNRFLEAVARVSSASLRARTGDPHEAADAFAGLLAHWRGHGDRTHLLTTLRNLVTLLDRLHRPEHAAELLGTVLDDDVVPTFGDERRMLERALQRAREQLGEIEVERRLAAGRGRTIDEAGRLAEHWLRAASA